MATSAFAQSLEEGKAAYLAKDYDLAFRILQPLANQGDAAAQVTLGIMYDYGQGVPEDDAKALDWYSKAALHGTSNLQHNLGVKYFEGVDVPRDYRQAENWWRMAADSGFAESQYSLGELYAWGVGLKKDEREAVKWYRLAADQGHTMAQYRLGVMYAAGRGVAIDYPQAYAWLRRAAGQGMPQAQYQVGRLLENGAGTTRNMKEAIRWYQVAANQGLEKAKQRLAALQARAQTRDQAVAVNDDKRPPEETSSAVAGNIANLPARLIEASGIGREDWIRAQPPHYFTLQLLTASSEQSVIDVINGANFGADATYFKRDLNGRIAYTAVYGVFATREQANDALATLPSAMRKSKPWVRLFAEVQALLLP
ncbi:MAG: SPOR domain-containing protein [Chromatiales bacterium]